MKRDKKWWARLNRSERVQLVWLEKDQHYYAHPSYYPDDCGECGHCGCPSLGGGLCNLCSSRLEWLLKKANGETR